RPLGSPALRDIPGRPGTLPAPLRQGQQQTQQQSQQTAQQQVQAQPQPSPQPSVQSEAQATSAREACGKRVFIALAVCMDDRCEEPRFRNTAECIGVIERKRARENR
ncbi:MAG: hypothetical protein M3Z29_16330, partial [Pseudomonadota bacterium]|nr:hypothetical protein [Pseudomonadota bacterium]